MVRDFVANSNGPTNKFIVIIPFSLVKKRIDLNKI